MQTIFRCHHLDGASHCQAMTMVWMAKSIEEDGVHNSLFLRVAPLELIQAAYDDDRFLDSGQSTELKDAAHSRQALEFFGFDVDGYSIASGPRNALAFQPLNVMAAHHGHSYLSITGLAKSHCLGARVHAGGWDLFDPSVGLLRYDSDTEFRSGARRHSMFDPMSQAAGGWAVLPVRGRRQPWIETLAQLI